MTNLGLGVMLSMLSEDGSAAAVAAVTGHRIVSLVFDEEAVSIGFEHGTLRLRDAGQSCCEHRYMTCDDDLTPFVGATFAGVCVREGNSEDDGLVHETEFLIVRTSLGEFTVCSHNEHNGYYGGFALRADFEPAER